MDKIRGPRDRHPSGKSLRRPEYRKWGDGYANRNEPKIVSLRKTVNTTAIGFLAKLDEYDEEN